MTPVPPPGTSHLNPRTSTNAHRHARRTGHGRRRVCAVAVLMAVVPVALGAVAVPASASISGYGPIGPDPASQLGLSVPVLAAEVSGPAGSTVSVLLDGTTVTVTRPQGYSSGSQVLSVTDLSGTGVAAALLPPGSLDDAHVVLGVGVGVRSVDTREVADALSLTGVSENESRTATAGWTAGSLTASAALTAAMPAQRDELLMVVDSPAIVGATMVVLDDTTETLVSPGQTVSLALDGPAAVFALQPGPGPEVPAEDAPVDDAPAQDGPADIEGLADAASLADESAGALAAAEEDGLTGGQWALLAAVLAAVGGAALLGGRVVRERRRQARW